MRAVFVNHCHPDTPHVCALRLTSFAIAMAARGHQVVLLTETLDPDDEGQELGSLADDLIHHDWAVPYSLAVKPLHNNTLSRLRAGQLPGGLRQLTIAGHYLFNSGLFGDWRIAASPYLEILAEHFQPDVIWASFGNTDVWSIAKDLSSAAGCPWVADIKDNWSAFLPYGFAQLIANRFKSAAHMTAFSKAHQAEGKRWFHMEPSVIYSGFDQTEVEADVLQDGRRILLTGSVYDDRQAAELIKGIATWARAGNADGLEVRYAGADVERMTALMAPLEGICDIIIDGFLELTRLRSLQAGAWVNAYMHSPRSLFQHKPLELLAAGRPVLAFPDESAEVKEIAREVGGTLSTCSTANEVVAFLNSLERDSSISLKSDHMNNYSWQSQAEVLERVLEASGQTSGQTS